MKKLLQLLLFVIIAFLPGIFGSFFSPGEWYEHLNKPSFTPPSWIFGPVWTALYVMIGISGYLAWKPNNSSLKKNAFLVFGIQLSLNGLWSWIFFGLNRIDIALLLISALLISIVVNAILFFQLNKLSGYLLIPYLLWVSFASVLNWSFYSLNN